MPGATRWLGGALLALSVCTGSVPPTPTHAATPQPRRSEARPPPVYFTFDDGPDPRWTPRILAVLARYHAHATFFVIGRQVQQYPKVVHAEAVAGDAVGNRTWDHRSLVGIGRTRFFAEIRQTQAAIKAALGAAGAPARCLRPPGGATDAATYTYARALGMRVVLWTVDPRDWSRPGAATIEARILAHVSPGAIVLLHDGGGDRSETVAALTGALGILRARGYRFVSPC